MAMNSKKISYFLVLMIFFLVGTIFGIQSERGFDLFQAKQYELNYWECNNLSLTETAECLTNYVRTFYKYNITNLHKDLTFEQLKEEGGVCRHYAHLYKDWLDELNMTYVSYVSIQYNETSSHAYTRYWGQEGYCILDQEVYFCFEFE